LVHAAYSANMHYATQQSRQFTVRSTAMIQDVNVWSTAAQLQYRGRRRPAYAATIPRPPYESSFWASKEAYETSRSRECGRRARRACVRCAPWSQPRSVVGSPGYNKPSPFHASCCSQPYAARDCKSSAPTAPISRHQPPTGHSPPLLGTLAP